MSDSCRHCGANPHGSPLPDQRNDYRCSACGAVGTWNGLATPCLDSSCQRLVNIRDIIARLLGSSIRFGPSTQLVDRSLMEELVKAAQ